MSPVLVVDAYNVIHDWWSPGNSLELGMCRDRLLGDLASYAAMQQVRTIVVFDAHQVPTKAVQESHSGLEVHYSAADETADTVIERLCFTLCDAGETVTVATSDRLQALVVFAFTLLPILPISIVMATRKTGAAAGAAAPNLPNQTIVQALGEAFKHRSYVLLVLGFFTCGFQLAFITVHMPAYLKDAGLPAWVGGWTLAVIGLANAVGSLSSGWLSTRMPKRHLLAWIYLGRAVAIAAFILIPASPLTALTFGVVIGLFWLSTVPPTSSLVMLMFGTKYMAMLYGFAFFSHQVGGFLGVWLGGVLYESMGNYQFVWWLSVALGVASALINLPIVERPVERSAAQPA